MDCPTCHNNPQQKVVAALVNRGGTAGCALEAHPCPTCGGGGEITQDHYERFAAGSVVHAERVDLHITIADMAILAGITPLDVSDYERGRLPVGHEGVRDKIYAAIQRVKTARRTGVIA